MEDSNGIFTLWLDFGDTFFIMNFKYLFFFPHGQMSVIQKYFISISVIFRKTWKKTQSVLVLKSHWFFFNHRWQFEIKESGKKNQLSSSSLCSSESFLLLSKLNFQFSPEYSASDSTYETFWLILSWIDLVSSSWNKLQFPFNFLADSEQ